MDSTRSTARVMAVQLGAVASAFALGAVLVRLFGFDPIEVYGVLIHGALGSLENCAWSLQNATPLIFTGLAVAMAFHCGLFNIGAEGQLVAGAFAAAVVGWGVPALRAAGPAAFASWHVYTGAPLLGLFVVALMRLISVNTGATSPRSGEVRFLKWSCAGLLALYALAPVIAAPVLAVVDALLLPASLLAAALAGALWAMGPGWLRAHLGISEVLNTIMFNFLATLLASYLLTTATFKAPGAIPQTAAVSPRAQLSELAEYAGSGPLNKELAATQLNTGFVMALAVAFAVAVLLRRSAVGYELRAVGLNAAAAQAQGIDVPWRLLTGMGISGALAGLGGAEQVLGVHHHFVKDFWTGLGFTGIAVALVGRNSPIGVVAAAILFGALQNGAVEIDMMTLFPRELILVLQALVIFLVASGPVLEELIGRAWKRWAASTSKAGDV